MKQLNSYINKKKYKFLPYSKKYPLMFQKEKRKIVNLLGKKIEIEHVGSTSIPGLGGKGIIDIAIKTPKSKLKQFTRKLKRLGYKSSLEHPSTAKSVFFQKIIISGKKERRVHVHLVLNEYFWDTFIVVRDYLRAHDKECKEYTRIKKEAFKYAKGEGKKYRAYKEDFLENLTKKAMNLTNKYFFESEKRTKFTYETEEQVKQKHALTSLQRAKEFLNEIEKIIEK